MGLRNPVTISLLRRRAETPEGNQIIWEAFVLSLLPKYSHLSEGELLRLAYWGVSGERT
jgi:hypothetical protein